MYISFEIDPVQSIIIIESEEGEERAAIKDRKGISVVRLLSLYSYLNRIHPTLPS